MKYIFWKPTPDSVDLMDAIVYSSDTFGLAPQDYAKRWPETALSVRQSIKDNFYGELPICQAIVVGILDEYKKKYLIVTPTCYSEAVPVSDKISYWTFRAILRIMKSWNAKHPEPWNVVVCPNLAQNKPPYRVAFQMRIAYEALHGLGPIHTVNTRTKAQELQKMMATIEHP